MTSTSAMMREAGELKSGPMPVPMAAPKTAEMLSFAKVLTVIEGIVPLAQAWLSDPRVELESRLGCFHPPLPPEDDPKAVPALKQWDSSGMTESEHTAVQVFLFQLAAQEPNEWKVEPTVTTLDVFLADGTRATYGGAGYVNLQTAMRKSTLGQVTAWSPTVRSGLRVSAKTETPVDIANNPKLLHQLSTIPPSFVRIKSRVQFTHQQGHEYSLTQVQTGQTVAAAQAAPIRYECEIELTATLRKTVSTDAEMAAWLAANLVARTIQLLALITKEKPESIVLIPVRGGGGGGDGGGSV